MPQTLLALLALMTATTMSLSWQRDSLRAQMNLIEAELQVEARGVVNEVFERVANLPFDENTDAETADDLSLESSFGSNRAWTDPGVDDIDDLHEMQPYDMVRTVNDPVTGEDVDVIFEITATVDYVDDSSGNELKSTDGERTFYKRFTVYVIPKVGYRDDSRSTITVSRVFSYGF